MATLEDHGVIATLTPIGGWFFQQLYAGEMFRIPHAGAAETGEALIAQVIQFRVNVNLPLGDPVYDVAQFTKARSPQNDRYAGRQIGQPRTEPREPIIKALRDWLEGLAQTKPELCGIDEANERAAICQTCPQNIKWQLETCGACNEALVEQGLFMRRRVSYAPDVALKACRLHKIYLPTAVFIDRDALPQRHQDAPAGCWVGKATQAPA